jgi:uncharacterized glyoxalase superfamily protein PhnB
MPTCKRILATPILTLTMLICGTVAYSQTSAANPGFIQLRYVTIVVRGYDEALRWYTEVLGWQKLEDRSFGADTRWIVVAPQGQKSVGVILDLARSTGSAEMGGDHSDRIGKETNWVFQVEDCNKLYQTLRARGVKFVEPPKTQPWGTVQAVLQDLYGNLFVVESPAKARSTTN